VYDARREATAPLEAAGATRAADLGALARDARVVFTSLPDDRAVEAVLLGADGHGGLMAGARPGDVVFDLSTVAPDSTRRLAARAAVGGVRLIDAPVSGSMSGAAAGTLAVMLGATAETSRRTSRSRAPSARTSSIWARSGAGTS
jgi:3-hydroxyisobutyrate dehydrogenase-like beta-hydroxyacid dehydrogenase